LASVISVSDFAVILEGPTSAGKTSCVNYLAQVTHNHVIRINNHMHTDVQEYLGSYVPDATSGKLVFQEGVLVEAVRKGYWVILDELNLAPSEVLEALNRLLDDNREVQIVET
jgi:midasin